MRKLLSILSMVLLFFACNNTPSYTITGHISSDSMNGQTIFLENFSDRKILDSAVVQGKKFEFKGTTDSSYVALLTVNNYSSAVVFVENGNIKINVPEEFDKSIITGTPLNDLHRLYSENLKPVTKKIDELREYASSQPETEALYAELDEIIKTIMKEIVQISAKFLNENQGTLVSAYLLLHIMDVMEADDEAVIQNTYDKLDQQVKDGVLGKEIYKRIERRRVKELAEGEMFRDLTLKTPDDKTVSISDYAGKGKYVLLDFWASWCGPCRAENPNVVALYAKYKNKDFEIVGVSLDNDKDNWIKGIADDGITWPQMSDLKGSNSEATIKYKIRGIPFTVLLDKEGKVIAINLRGDALRDKVKSLIK
ncbi:MAG: AhpC/TSA family protein [Prevotellaceae bacterium]|nr:AhpC/TSA family protein [Prevotellaceae bacterium]